jgi:hypothetical protein
MIDCSYRDTTSQFEPKYQIIKQFNLSIMIYAITKNTSTVQPTTLPQRSELLPHGIACEGDYLPKADSTRAIDDVDSLIAEAFAGDCVTDNVDSNSSEEDSASESGEKTKKTGR